jgi:hypothetical protein
MNKRKPWQPHLREEPIFNPFEPSTDWTRDLGANERVEVPDEEEEAETKSADQGTGKSGDKPPSK